MQAKMQIERKIDLGTDYKDAVRHLKSTKIKCKKYNNTLDAETQKFFNF